MKRLVFSLLAGALLVGCSSFGIRGGKSAFQITQAGVVQGKVKQSVDPKEATVQIYDRTTETPVAANVYPTFSPIVVPQVGAQYAPPATVTVITNGVARTTEHFETRIGAAQKDTAQDITAKLKALKGIVWVGVLIFLFGVASFVYPPLKVLVGGSVTTSAVIAGAGVALMILPTLIVGHEILILAIAGGAAGLYWFAHRHGSLQGSFNTLVSQITHKPAVTSSNSSSSTSTQVII
jgi:hypothetical protein